MAGAGGYEVQLSALGEAARAARDAASRVQQWQPAPVLEAAGAGIPGADAVALLSDVAAAWAGEVTLWVSETRDYAAGLDASAATYEASESAAVRDFSALGGGLPWP